MIPSDIRLYTWIDVEDILLRKQRDKDWPKGVLCARAYWDGLFLDIQPGHKAEAVQWLEKAFEPRFKSEEPSILLESEGKDSRILPVFFEEAEEAPPKPRTIPTLARPTVVSPPFEYQSPSALPDDCPPVVAFHSFKGGVGRTLHALTFAQLLVRKPREKSRILLIDGDLEAPGLTWLLYSRIPRPTISFVDFLALVHGDPAPGAASSIHLTGERVKDMFLDGIFILPAFRAISHFNSLEVKPEHLITSAQDPYLMTRLLAELGKAVEADAVIIDLRAGLSEFSTGLLLDPRVYRVLVTTLSSQSIEGTCQLLNTIAEFTAPGSENEIPPSIVISQIPSTHRANRTLLQESNEKLLRTSSLWVPEDEDDSALSMINLLETSFEQDLLILPNDWGKMISQINQSTIIKELTPLSDWLPLKTQGIDSEKKSTETEPGLQEKRKKLDLFSQDMIYAETSSIEKFLRITPLRHLASDSRNKVPVVVVVGAKGAGKTYTYLQIARRGTWDKFVLDAVKMKTGKTSLVCPIMYSKNIKQKAREELEKLRRNTIHDLGLHLEGENTLIADYIRDKLKKNLHEGEWRECWLNVIAWKCGFKPGQEDVAKSFNEYLKSGDRYVIAVIDGLEDLFQNLSSMSKEQTALRSLLQDVPEWLELQPSRQIGLVVFVREDMVINSVRQNSAQLMKKYSPYALKWDPVEALRLVAWIAIESGIFLEPEKKGIQEMDKAELVEYLIQLWGKKLGSDKSNEARSAEWVISVLSDLNGQIQARDIVRLLNQAAKDSQKERYKSERILVPQVIRNSVDECSKRKIEEISQENPTLGKILNKLKDKLDLDSRRIPFSQEQVKLEPGEISILEDNGVITKERGEYYMPEIFRRGLEFKYRIGARPRVISLSRRSRS